jgi:phage/conjugal plasmid C-4 type zinc finger TraR family protein
MIYSIEANEDGAAQSEEIAAIEAGTNFALRERSKFINPHKKDRNCEDCGKPIPRERLKLIPNCRFCVSCQSGQEFQRPVRGGYITKADEPEEKDTEEEDDKSKKRIKISATPIGLPSES